MHRADNMTVAIPSTDTREDQRTSGMAWLNTFARKQPLGVIGGLILIFIVLLAFLAPVISPFDPYAVHVTYKYAAPGTVLESTGQRFWLGADQLGRDTLSRLVYGARISLYVSLISVGIGVTLGALIGIMSAYFGGKVDLLVQRLVDTVMAFPAIILALAVVSVFGAALRNVILSLIIFLTPAAARVVRAQALSVKEMDYVLAARAMGANNVANDFLPYGAQLRRAVHCVCHGQSGLCSSGGSSPQFSRGRHPTRRAVVGWYVVDYRAKIRRGLTVAGAFPELGSQCSSIRFQSAWRCAAGRS